ncbi:hypothetical protein EYZ11_005616 [Aspergillus tanneri]|nr:hypothetical protein EYZ11_005616 [Aspergillus tanneri]
MCQGSLDANHFQSIVPRMAMSHPYLLDSLLAFSSLHLASIEVDDKCQWLEVALMYQNRACSTLSQVLADFSLESCGPAFVSSIFIMLCATAYPCISQDSRAFDPLAHVLETRRLIAGCSFLFQQLGKMEQLGEMKGWLQYNDPDKPQAADELES